MILPKEANSVYFSRNILESFQEDTEESLSGTGAEQPEEGQLVTICSTSQTVKHFCQIESKELSQIVEIQKRSLTASVHSVAVLCYECLCSRFLLNLNWLPTDNTNRRHFKKHKKDKTINYKVLNTKYSSQIYSISFYTFLSIDK